MQGRMTHRDIWREREADGGGGGGGGEAKCAT